MTRLVLALVVTGLFAQPLQAQRAGTPAQRIDAAIATAVREGVPADLLRSRVAEGRAKRVPEERIALVVEARAGALRAARQALVPAVATPTGAEIAAGADALESGVPAGSIGAVARAAAAEERPVALAVLAELVRQGVPAAEALERVSGALGSRGNALANLARQAAAEGGRGGPPAGVGGRPDGVGGGRPASAGPPAGVPGAGQRPSNPGQGRGRPGGNQ